MFTNVVNAAVPLGAAATVATFNTSAARTLGFELKNSGANPFGAVELWARFSDAGALFKVASLAADFTTPVYPVVKSSASPVTLAAATSAWVALDVSNFSQVVLKIGSTGGASLAEVHGCAKFST